MNEDIELSMGDVARVVNAFVVVDVSTDGTVVGVEVLDVSKVFGTTLLRTSDTRELRIDEVADALYLRLNGKSIAGQEVCDATFFLSADNLVLRVSLARTNRAPS